jgi:outer membrane protein OmpA-like peptidoglycan-associated protein
MKHLILAATLLASTAALAQTSATEGTLTTEGVSTAPSGLVPFLGLGAGYLTNQDQSNNDIEGTPASAKILGSYYAPRAGGVKGVFDLGFGIAGQQFSREAATVRSLNGPSLEAAARYQWSNRWQAGAVMNTLFDKGSYYGANQGDAQFAGLQVLKEFDVSATWLGRAGLRAMTDLNIDGQTVNTAMIDLQFGWNPARKQSVSNVASNEDLEIEDINREPASMFAGDTGYVSFEFDSAALDRGDQTRLERLASSLDDRTDLFESVTVIGHADPIGTEAYNQRLSERRAQSVHDALVSYGWPVNNLEIIGLGERQPLTTEENSPEFAENRRVQIQFKGVTNEEELRRILSSIE